MGTWETFKLSELRLDQQNYRTGRTAGQRESIAAIIDEQGRKLVRLAEDILAMSGVSPGEPIWVTRDVDTPGMYIVLEGNRRVAALKLMENPALADGAVVEKAFSALAKQYAERPIRELEARVFPTRDDALPWQRRRHLSSASGVGLQNWKPIAKGRANLEQGLKAPRFLTVVDYLQDETEDWSEIAAVLDSKWTTVDRVLNSSSLPSVLGVSIDPRLQTITFENGDESAGRELLMTILRALAAPEFRFEQIEKDPDREAFVNRFAALTVKAKLGSEPVKPASVSPTPRPPPPIAPPPSKPPLTSPPRSTLAPKASPKAFKVNGDRLNSIYKECRSIELKGNENAASLLLRVFIELSSEALLSEKAIAIPPNLIKSGKSKWDDIGIRLTDKVGAVLNLIDSSGRDKDLQTVRVARDPTSHAVYSINTLHGYFHNRAMKPDATAIREAWDAWENYLRLLHQAR